MRAKRHTFGPLDPRTYYQRLAKQCGTWAIARMLFKQGVSLHTARYLLLARPIPACAAITPALVPVVDANFTADEIAEQNYLTAWRSA